ncbi:MAG TPA: hypothetical protein VKV19_13075 [Ktedonobacteraceae bacterium]|nr:hypothetical protein [Ktedonobacteraceae bacterium]
MGSLVFWMVVVVAVVVLVVGARSLSRPGGRYPSVWVCGLLAVVALVWMWVMLNAQFGGQVIRFQCRKGMACQMASRQKGR